MAHRTYEYPIPDKYKNISHFDLAYNQFKRTKSGYVAIVYKYNTDDNSSQENRRENLSMYYFDPTEKTALINTMIGVDDRCKISGDKWVVYSFGNDLTSEYIKLPENEFDYASSMRVINITGPMIDIINMARSIKELM